MKHRSLKRRRAKRNPASTRYAYRVRRRKGKRARNPCPACGAHEAVELGALGNLQWLRCRDCGMEYNRKRRLRGGASNQRRRSLRKGKRSFNSKRGQGRNADPAWLRPLAPAPVATPRARVALRQKPSQGVGATHCDFEVWFDGKKWDDAYYNMTGYRATLPVPGRDRPVARLELPGDVSLSRLRAEVRTVNREWQQIGRRRMNPRRMKRLSKRRR